MMDATLRQLLQQVVTHPAEDSIRLMYADRCDELGEHDRAEFIRVQVELEKLREMGCHEGETCNNTGPCSECNRDVEAEPLRRRERELWSANADNQWIAAPCLPGFDFRHLPSDKDESKGRPHLKCCYYSRGFISSITCTADDFLKHADQLVWNEGMLDECKVCKGYGGNEPDAMNTWNCTACGGDKDNKGIGRIPRPMPDTAQPIEKVNITNRVIDAEVLNKLEIWVSRNPQSSYTKISLLDGINVSHHDGEVLEEVHIDLGLHP